jgi:hypothetical protein
MVTYRATTAFSGPPGGASSRLLDLSSLVYYQSSHSRSTSTLCTNHKILPLVEARLKTALAAGSSTEHNPKVEVVPCSARGTINKNASVLVVLW